jgi:hypothetical protein
LLEGEIKKKKKKDKKLIKSTKINMSNLQPGSLDQDNPIKSN